MASLDNPQIPFPVEFQIYPYQQYSGLTNMAIDHYFASKFDKINKPIFRFYGWKPYCVSLGFHQSSKTIDKELLEKDGFELIKRPTGGRAIFHSEELTYSVIFPKAILSQNALYNYIHQILTQALNNLSYEVKLAMGKPKLPKLINQATDYPCFTRSAETEVEYDGKKLIGSAQKIYQNSILQHGSILIGNFHENLSKYLFTNENDRYLIEKELKSKTNCLNNISDSKISPEQIESEVLNQLESDDKISLIFMELEDDLTNTALREYKKEFENNEN